VNSERASSAFAGVNPGLSALVLYFRPVAREGVLRTLVSLGVFAREVDHSAGCASLPPRPGRADFAVAFVTGDDQEAEVIASYSELVNSLLVVLPASHVSVLSAAWEFDELSHASSEHCLDRDAVLRVAQVARRRADGRVAAAQRTPAIIFGGLMFRPGQPWLQSGAEIAGLSPTEFGVLRALVSARGSIVSKSALQLELTGGGEAASDGYLKTVVLRIRRKVERLGGDASLLAAIRGSGYVLKA
jgi:hypothetical protein